MTNLVHRLLIVPTANKEVARTLVLQLSPESSTGMFSTPLSPDGTGTPTHWVSSGLISEEFAPLLGNAEATHAVFMAAGGTGVTLADVENLYSAAVIRDDAQWREHEVFSELGLMMISEL